jgi:hypothetical protein
VGHLLGRMCKMPRLPRPAGKQACLKCEQEKPRVQFLCSVTWNSMKICRDCSREHKWCRRCKKVKTKAEFPLAPKTKYKDGLLAWCRVCRNEYNKENRNLPENRERILQWRRDRRRKDKYGLEPGQFNIMIQEQGGLCGLCGEPFTNEKPPRVDHCHQTGQVRSLLHSSCNVLIGMAGESENRLIQAIEYLQRHRKEGS